MFATVALRVMDCGDVENVTVALAAVVDVAAAMTVRLLLPELPTKSVPGL
jgi:hypothetical protein